jgi:hypothetical protein
MKPNYTYYLKRLTMQVVPFSKGQKVIHTLSGMKAEFVSLGHYPDTMMISIPSHKADENDRVTEVYAKHVQEA